MLQNDVKMTPKGVILRFAGSVKTVFLDAGDADEFFQRAEKLEGELWISCTSPLKHSVWKRLGCESEEEIQAVNQLVRMDGEWSVSNSDGRGFIMACRHIGVEPGGSILRIRGGGSRTPGHPEKL